MWRRTFRPSDDDERIAISLRRRLLLWTGWFGVANTLFLVLVSLRNLAVSDAPQGALARLYGLLMFVGHNAFLAFLHQALPGGVKAARKLTKTGIIDSAE